MKTNHQRLDFIKSLPTKPIPCKVKFTVDGKFLHYMLDEWFDIGIHVGGDGFGFEWDGEKLVEFPQRGDVKIGEDVRIGANVCIDRATLEGNATEIGDGTKIDNLVHIAHNVKIGKHCMIGAGTVIGGSAEIGDRVCIWGGCFIERKLKIGNGAEIRGGSALFSDVGENEVWAGNPAKLIFKQNDD